MKIHQLITRDTWGKGVSINKNRLCAFEWVRSVYGTGEKFREAYSKLRKVINFRPVVGWNDNARTEYEEVWSAFKKADI